MRQVFAVFILEREISGWMILGAHGPKPERAQIIATIDIGFVQTSLTTRTPCPRQRSDLNAHRR